MKRAKYIVLTTALVSSIAMGNASMALASEVTDLPEVQEELAEIPEDDALSDEDNEFFLETEISEEEGMEEESVPVEESEQQMEQAEELDAVAASESTENFDYSIGENGVTITKYTGKEKQVVIPDIIEGKAVTGIGNYAFANCKELEEAELPEGLETIGTYAFQNCSSLEKVTIPESVSTIGRHWLDGCPDLKSAGPMGGGYNIEFGWKTEIPKSAFEYCKQLESVKLPDGLKKIGGNAFGYCTGLNKLVIPESVEVLEVCWMGWNSRTPSVCGFKTAGPIGGGYDLEFGWKTEIPEGAFAGSALENITLPEGLTKIGDFAFSDCNEIENLILPNSLQEIGNQAIQNCEKLKKIVIPKNTKTIGSSWFHGCNFKTVGPVGGGYDIEYEWESEIPAQAFQWSLIESVELSDKIKKIGDRAFYYCENLSSIQLPEGLETIGEKAFRQCLSLKSIRLPKSLTSISDDAFLRDNAQAFLYEVYPNTVGYKHVRSWSYRGYQWKLLDDDGNYVEYINVTFDSNGGSAVEPVKVKFGQKLKKPTDPTKAGYDFVGWYRNPALTVQYWFMDDLEEGDLTLYAKWAEKSGVPKPTPDPEPDADDETGLYDDVPGIPGWRYDAIKYVTDHGIMNGISGTRNFAPDDPLTRAMFATMIYRMEGSPKASYSAKFPDVPDGNYFSVPILWANKVGIINGHSNTGLFGTRENITREDMVVIMYRYCKYKGIAANERASLSSFPDAGQVSGYAKDAVQWAVANGIIKGRSNTGMLDPKGSASRVETAAVIQRFMNHIGK